MKRLGLLFLMSYAVSGAVAHAATYYVSKAGSNSHSCAQAQSTSTPKLSIAGGLECLAAGDTLLVRAGTYDEGIVNSVPSGTSWANKVRIAAYPGETVWMTPLVSGRGNNGYVIFFGGAAGVSPQYIEFDGINLDDTHMPYVAVRFDEYGGANPNHIRIQNAEVIEGATGGAGAILIGSNDNEFINLRVHGGGTAGGCGWQCASYGFYIAGDRNLIENCDVYDTSMMGIQIYSSSGSPDNNIVRNCRIHDITRSGDHRLAGILVSGANNHIYNNLIYGLNFRYSSGNAAISVYGGSGAKIYNNTIYGNTTDGINISSASNVEVKNNIVYGGTGPNFVNGGSGTAQSNNLFGTDPHFVNPSATNFELQAASPAVDTGTGLSIVTTDFLSRPRPQGAGHDIGAHEFGLSSSAPSTPAGVRIVQP